MKKSLLALLSVFILLFTACDTWMQNDDFFADIESDVKVANAPQISVYVRYALTRQGKTDPDGPATFKVEIPQEVSATTETEYGFVRWAAFTTDFIATGDNQSKNKDIYFIDEEDYNSRLLPHEIKAPAVVFEKPTSATTKVTINENRNDLFLVPIVAQRPAVSLTIPAKGSSGVVRNMSVRINFTKPMDEASFKNEAGEFDKITVTQGIQSFTADGDIEINSEDITDYFEAPVFSKNKKMLTLKFKPERLSEGYSSQSSVNITISKDVKDIYGFAMTDDDKISFSVGSYKDTLAPRITQLSAGRTGSDFHRFLGVYKDAGTINSVGAATKMTLEGAANAPLNDIDASFYDTYIPYRVTDKVIIRVLAEDISGSGSGQSQTGIETDVAMVGMRAYHMYNSDGSTSTFTYTPATADTAAQAFKFLAVNYQPQMNLTTSVPGAYKSLIQAVNENIEGTENDFAFDKGCLLEMDVSDLPDGLIRIDVAAVDMVQNSGFSDGGALSEEYGNAWASLFVIKDTTPPDASANSSFVSVDTSASTLITADHYFNEATYSNVKIAHDLSSLADAGHARLRSPHDSLKWIVKPTAETNWISTINASNAAWLPVTSDYAPFPLPTNQGEVHYTYALMDDVGNISAASAIPPIYYDSVAPVVGNLSFVADEGYTAGVAKDNILDEQTLIIPITEETSGLKSIEVKVRKAGAAEDYASPLSYSGLVVTTAGQAVPYTLDEAKKVLTFTTPQTNFNSDVRIKGIKLSDDLGEQGSFEVNVVVKDAAAAASVHEIQPAVKAISNTDSVPVVIDQIYIPNLKETVRHGGTTPEYWVDYTSTNAQALTKPAGANPRTDVYIKFTEATSGAKIFDFAGSSMHLTADSMIYKINEADGAIIGGTAIAATPDLANNRLLINSAADAAANFAGGQMTVKITQVELASEGTASTIALKIHDTATNPSEVNGTIRSNEGGLSLASPTIEVSSAGFKFDTAAPSASTPHGSLADRDNTEVASTATEASGKTAAELGYTNEVYINQTIYLTSTASGIEGLTIVGDASFDSTTTITEGAGSSVYYDIISADNKTVRFKKGGDGADANSHVVLGAGTTVTLTIHNLKLTAGDGTSGDGTKTVTVKPAGFGGVKDATGSSDYIILDRQPPVWNSANTGLYTTTDNSVLDGHVYPHPSASPYGIPGSQVLNATDTSALYFYRNSNISIRPDVIDDNKKSDETLITYTHNDTVLSNSAAYLYTPETGSFTATATDRAGNKSTIKTFNIIPDTKFANENTGDDTSEINQLDQYMTLYRPTGAFIHRNATVTGGTTEYVIKGSAQYQIRVKLGGATTISNEAGNEETIDAPGTDATNLLPSPYVKKDNTTTSSKIEYFSIAQINDITSDPSTPTASEWKTYAAGDYTIGSIPAHVDATGTIIIDIPTGGCNPLVLWLKDGCGNYTFRSIRPAAMAGSSSSSPSIVKWLVDTEIGVDGYRGTLETTTHSASRYADSEAFYKDSNTPVLNLSHFSESCRFPLADGEAYSEVGTSSMYSLKSRIIIWQGTGNPDRNDFYNTSLVDGETASAWCYRREIPESQSASLPAGNEGTSFSITINFPKYETTNTYKLFYILEDTVGNYKINQIKCNGENLIISPVDAPVTGSAIAENWLYDNTAPTVENFTYAKVNTVAVDSTNYNYYSGNSTVTYNIYDAGSGIRNAGNGNNNYTTFASRRSGSSTNPESETKSLISACSTTDSGSHTLSINDIKDYAGNTRATTTDPIPLSYNSVSNWIRQSSAPTLTEINETHENNAWAVKTSLLGAVTPTLSPDGDTGGQVLSIKAKARTTSLNVSLYVADSTPLLGWYISDEPLTFTGSNPTGKDFYSATELSQNNTAQGFTINYSSGAYVIAYDKGLFNYTAWHAHDTFKNAKYYYPVNRAGLIGKPIKVQFIENVKPAIVNGDTNTGYTYSDYTAINENYLKGPTPTSSNPLPTIKWGNVSTGTGTSPINFIRDGATVTFETNGAFSTDSTQTTICKVIYSSTTGAGEDNVLNTEDDITVYTGEDVTLTAYSGENPDGSFTIHLDSTTLKSQLTPANGTPLKLQLLRGTEEDSDVYDLLGPAGNNLWVYDNTTPGVGFGETPTIKSGSSTGSDAVPFDETNYIQNENAYISWSLSNATFGDASDIAHYQWNKRTCNGSTGIWSDWVGWSTDISWEGMSDSAIGSSGITFPADHIKTEYKFRVVDKAGNISAETAAIRLQRDDAAPTGTLNYTTNNATGSVNLAGNDTELATNSRLIKYSKSSSSPYYINKIDLDLSPITDDITTSEGTRIEKSGIQKFQIIKEHFNDTLTATESDSIINIWNCSSLPDGAAANDVLFDSDKHYQIDLSQNPENTYYQYTVKAFDNINNPATTLYTFRTQADNQAPGFPQPGYSDIKAVNADGSGTQVNSVKEAGDVGYPNPKNDVFFIKNDRVIVNFTPAESEYDKDAHYRWSTDNTHWYEFNSSSSKWEQYVLDSTSNTYVKVSPAVELQGDAESFKLNDTTHTISFSFAAPDDVTTYFFMAEDLVGNVSKVGATDCIKLQRDKWEPSGNLTYKFYNGTNHKVLSDGLDTAGDNENIRNIKYSYVDTETNYVNKLDIDLSAITDVYDGKERSNIRGFWYSDDGIHWNRITLTDGLGGETGNHFIITLDGTTKTYTIGVTDWAGNLGSNKLFGVNVLKTFNLTANTDLPDFALAGTSGTTTRVMKKDNTEGASPVSCEAKTSSTTNEVYYLNKDKAVINFTKTHTDITSYQVSKSTDGGTSWSDWEPITPTVDTNDATSHKVSYEFDTPTESTTYKFKAVDDVLNETVISTTITLQKDTDDPIEDVTYSFKKEEPAGTVSAAIGNTYYNDNAETTATTRPIIYNADEINRFELDLSPISDATSGVRRFWLTKDSTEIELSENSNPKLDSNICLIELATTDNTTQTVKISAEDWAGNKRDVKTFTLTADAAGPGFTMGAIQAIDSASQTNNAWQNTTTGTYYLRGETAVINFTKTGTDIVKYEVKAVSGGSGGYAEIPQTLTDENGNPYANPNLTIENTAVTYKFSAPETATTYTFKFTDRVGHVQEMTTDAVTLVKDTNAPELGTDFVFTAYKDSTPAQIVDATHSVADYTVSTNTETGVITINYNPTKVNNLVFNLSDIVDTGSGIEKFYYDDSDHEMTLITGTGYKMTLENNWSNQTYQIIAKDNAGNVSDTLKTIVFNADSTGPVIEATDYTRSNDNTVKQINCYTSSVGNIPYAKWMRKFTLQRTNYYASGTQIMFVKNSLDGAVQYQLIQTRTTDAIPATADTAEVPASDGYTAVAATTENSWQTLTEGTGENAGKYIFTLPDITTPYTRLSFFFRDVLGNVSGPYYLGNNTIDTTTNPITNQIGIQWWLTKVAPLSADNINITSVTWNNNGTSASGWGGKLHDYIVTLTLPAGTLVNSVFLAPKAGNANTGVVFSSNLPQGISNSLQFSGYTNESDNINNIKGKYDGEGYIVLPSSAESTTGTVTMVIYPHDVEDANKGNILVKFNVQNADSEGVSKQIFPPENPNINRFGNLGFTLGDGSGESAGARLVQFFNSFVSKDEEALTSTAVDNSIAEKASKTKKAAKKAKKATKKNNKKASDKVVSTGSTTGRPGMAVETAEILAQNEKSTLPEIAVATETVVNEIAGVTEKVSGEADVVSIRPAGYSTTESSAASTAASADSETQSASAPEAAADKRTPSRSASIVIMLAILSSFGAVWYLQRNRKK